MGSPPPLCSVVGRSTPRGEEAPVGRASEDLAADSRVAEPAEAISVEELQLATRNHGMPLEALRYDVTPVGLHYLLVHFDIPAIDLSNWRLRIGGNVRNALELTLDELRRRPRVTTAVTIEC